MRRLAPDVRPAGCSKRYDRRRGALVLRGLRLDRRWEARGLIAVRVPHAVEMWKNTGQWHRARRDYWSVPSRNAEEPANRLKVYASFVRFSHSVFALRLPLPVGCLRCTV